VTSPDPAATRYWLQGRVANRKYFVLLGRYSSAAEARKVGGRLHAGGNYAQIVVKDVDTGRMRASFGQVLPHPRRTSSITWF
jgi:hypothetical protein